MDTALVISFLTAFGLGSIVTAFVQSYIATKQQIDQRRFEERKSAYIGLLEAFRDAHLGSTSERIDEAGKVFGYWQMRCDLVASEPVRKSIQAVLDADREDQPNAVEKMKSAMRSEIGLTK